jgi:hypothetical protein
MLEPTFFLKVVYSTGLLLKDCFETLANFYPSSYILHFSIKNFLLGFSLKVSLETWFFITMGLNPYFLVEFEWK